MDDDVHALLGYDRTHSDPLAPQGIRMDTETVGDAVLVALFIERKTGWSFYPFVFADGVVDHDAIRVTLEEHHRRGTPQP